MKKVMEIETIDKNLETFQNIISNSIELEYPLEHQIAIYILYSIFLDAHYMGLRSEGGNFNGLTEKSCSIDFGDYYEGMIMQDNVVIMP
jgi:hypothetical protein